ncbi:MAG: hypothetical protein WC980_06945 [Candidatus Brocadiia bacterium]
MTIKELIEQLNRIKDRVQSNPKQNYSWLYEKEFQQEYSIGNIKNLAEHELDIQALIRYLGSFRDHLKNEVKSLGKNPQIVEAKVKKDKTLCIIIDLDNWLKHGELKRSRSGLFPKLERPGITAEQKDIEYITIQGNKIHSQLKDTNLIKPSTLVLSNNGVELGKAEDIALKAIDSWLIICQEFVLL